MSRILLVEDNSDNRDMLSRRLERRGFQVLIAADGGEACQQALREIPDLILLDMHLPVLDGWEVAQCLKTDPTTKEIPILALTADAMAGDREKALEAGCDDYETKPIDFPHLLQKMEAMLQRESVT